MDQTFVLYRILGNDLPPRHGRRQTVDSLRFILDHEPAFPGCEKRWLLNRIADPEREAELITLLEERDAIVLRIPFDLREYGKQFLDADGLPTALNPIGALAGKVQSRIDVYAYEWIYRRKNLYAININAARNFVVADGIASGATWVMPFDGQCFLTAPGFEAIRATAQAAEFARYLLVPMFRVEDNALALDADFKFDAENEPQVIFRKDARDRFDEALRYGHANKSEFVVRIGGPRDWYDRTTWEPKRIPVAADNGLFAKAGWVVRLASGANAAADTAAKIPRRWLARFSGVARHSADLDAQIVRTTRARNPLVCYWPLLARAGNGNVIAAATTRDAEQCATTTASASLTFREMMVAATTLTIAAEITANRGYASRAAAIVHRWFTTEEEVQPGTKPAGLVDLAHLWAFGDALRMLDRAGELSEVDRLALSGWFRRIRRQFLRGDHAVDAANHIGVLHDLALAGVAAYCDDHPLLALVLNRGSLRMHRQVQPWGWQPGETGGARPLHQTLLALQGLIALAWMARNCGVDLWSYAGTNHRSIPMAARFVALNRALFSDYGAAAASFDDRIEMSLRAIPADAADVVAINGLSRRELAGPRHLGTTEGFAPLWPTLLATEAENAAFGMAADRNVA